MPTPDSTTSVSPVSAEEGTSFGAWTLVWVLYITKLITVILVVWAAHSYDTAVLVTVTTWFWLGPLVALGAAPAMLRLRLRKVRSRRAALIEREWNLSEVNEGPPVSRDATPK
jgi:hypothetical protein